MMWSSSAAEPVRLLPLIQEYLADESNEATREELDRRLAELVKAVDALPGVEGTSPPELAQSIRDQIPGQLSFSRRVDAPEDCRRRMLCCLLQRMSGEASWQFLLYAADHSSESPSTACSAEDIENHVSSDVDAIMRTLFWGGEPRDPDKVAGRWVLKDHPVEVNTDLVVADIRQRLRDRKELPFQEYFEALLESLALRLDKTALAWMFGVTASLLRWDFAWRELSEHPALVIPNCGNCVEQANNAAEAFREYLARCNLSVRKEHFDHYVADDIETGIWTNAGKGGAVGQAEDASANHAAVVQKTVASLVAGSMAGYFSLLRNAKNGWVGVFWESLFDGVEKAVCRRCRNLFRHWPVLVPDDIVAGVIYDLQALRYYDWTRRKLDAWVSERARYKCMDLLKNLEPVIGGEITTPDPWPLLGNATSRAIQRALKLDEPTLEKMNAKSRLDLLVLTGLWVYVEESQRREWSEEVNVESGRADGVAKSDDVSHSVYEDTAKLRTVRTPQVYNQARRHSVEFFACLPNTMRALFGDFTALEIGAHLSKLTDDKRDIAEDKDRKRTELATFFMSIRGIVIDCRHRESET